MCKLAFECWVLIYDKSSPYSLFTPDSSPICILILGEGGHEAHLEFFGYAVEPMSKATFYFAIAVLVVVDLIQTKYQRKLDALRAYEHASVRRVE